MDKAAIVFKKFFSGVADLAANTMSLPKNVKKIISKPTMFQAAGRKLHIIKNKQEVAMDIAKGMVLPTAVAVPIGVATKALTTDHPAEPEKM